MKNFFMWMGVFICLIFIAGLVPNSAHMMLVLVTIAVVLWCAMGVVMAIRGLYRFMTAHPRVGGH